MIRPAVPGDLAHIVAIDPIAQRDDARRIEIAQAIERGDCAALFDGDPSRLVGYRVMQHHFFGRSFIELVLVASDARRRGFASALVRDCERSSRSATLFTSTNESNAPMRALLERLGYRRSGIIENLDPGDPELIYCKDGMLLP